MWARVSDDCVLELIAFNPSGKFHPSISWLPCPANAQPGWIYNGNNFSAPVTPPPTVSELCALIDAAADAARHKVAGDPLRAVEYERAARQAADFANADYQGSVPEMVAAWVTPSRSAQQAADNIISEALAYNDALIQLRTTRLQAKEHIRALMASNEFEQAKTVANQTVADIEAAVAGIGNNA